MAIPEEDLGPRSLRNYGFHDFGDIAADIAAMEDFAARLAADVDKSYAPHMDRANQQMSGQLPEPVGFPELIGFLTVHREAQEATQSNIYNFAAGTQDFAAAAKTISEKYQGTDAFARAKVADVETAFQQLAAQSTDTTGRETH